MDATPTSPVRMSISWISEVNVAIASCSSSSDPLASPTWASSSATAASRAFCISSSDGGFGALASTVSVSFENSTFSWLANLELLPMSTSAKSPRNCSMSAFRFPSASLRMTAARSCHKKGESVIKRHEERRERRYDKLRSASTYDSARVRQL